MGVRLRALQRWSNGRVPFESDDNWAIKQAEEFNRAVGKTIFVTRNVRLGHHDYVVMRAGSAQSNIGRNGGCQTLNYAANNKYSIYHEMGHCVGLGHEYFHPNWTLRERLLGICPCRTYAAMNNCSHLDAFDRRTIHKLAFLLSVSKYIQFGIYDRRSIMSYNPNNMGMNGIPYNQPQKLSAGDVSLVRRLYPDALPF